MTRSVLTVTPRPQQGRWRSLFAGLHGVVSSPLSLSAVNKVTPVSVFEDKRNEDLSLECSSPERQRSDVPNPNPSCLTLLDTLTCSTPAGIFTEDILFYLCFSSVYPAYANHASCSILPEEPWIDHLVFLHHLFHMSNLLLSFPQPELDVRGSAM